MFEQFAGARAVRLPRQIQGIGASGEKRGDQRLLLVDREAAASHQKMVALPMQDGGHLFQDLRRHRAAQRRNDRRNKVGAI